jgi:hypothetical protein
MINTKRHLWIKIRQSLKNENSNLHYDLEKSNIFKGYFPPKIDIQTRISGVQHMTQNFTLISNLHTVFYLVAYI